jgi:type I restriction enzyme S subunit
MAWEGAFGIVPDEADNCVMSGAFVSYEVNRERIDPKYLDNYFKIESVWKSIGGQSTGTNVRRRSLHPDNFEKAIIPLPPLTEQRRIVARIEELAAKIEEARGLRKLAMDEADRFPEGFSSWVFQKAAEGFNIEELGGLIRMASGKGLTSSEMDDSYPYPVYGGGLAGKYSRYLFEEPTIAIGPVGARCGCVFLTEPKSWITDNALYITEASDRLDRDYLVYALSNLDLRQQANQAAQPVVSQKKINPMKIPVPPKDEQRRIVAYLDELQSKVDALKKLQQETAKELEAMLPSVLDKAFKGEL